MVCLQVFAAENRLAYFNCSSRIFILCSTNAIEQFVCSFLLSVLIEVFTLLRPSRYMLQSHYYPRQSPVVCAFRWDSAQAFVKITKKDRPISFVEVSSELSERSYDDGADFDQNWALWPMREDGHDPSCAGNSSSLLFSENKRSELYSLLPTAESISALGDG